ncbi:pancreatic secretory granule membrane major glycoprotein GP2-like [Saccopteryx leptura]|uniref:pancreatic secretory granule membrane major glycoprotein GP2-like n=1 Tax=Saccopteryx leptura TaxID=249018 RepID=UPI00339D0014
MSQFTETMTASYALWLAVAACVLTRTSAEQQGSGNPTPGGSYALGLLCGAPGSPEPPLCVEPCLNYTLLDDPSRSTENANGAIQCDNTLHDWVRFVGEGGVRMPESCVPINRCQTSAPMWLNGAHPTLAEGLVTRTACAHWAGNCCYWNAKVQVKACPGGYHVYQLEGTPGCNLRYCTDPTTAGETCEQACRPEEECLYLNGSWGCSCRRDLNSSDIHSLQPRLDCGDAEIKVSLDKCRLGALGFGDNVTAYLRNQSCSSLTQREEKNWISVTSPPQAHACGNILERNETHAIYRNTLSLADEFILRETKLSVHFQCAYPLDMQVSLQTALRPIVSSVNISLAGEGEFTVRMALFRDQNYTLPFEGAEALLSLNSTLYVGAFLERGDTGRFRLLLRNCYATPTANRTDPVKYFIIRDSCPNEHDPTLSVEENGVSSEGRFSLQMFRFAGSYDLVFLHCEVRLCDALSQQCEPFCSGSQLRREAAAIDPAMVLDLGPITRKGALSLGVMNGSPRTAGLLAVTPVLLLPVLLAGLL